MSEEFITTIFPYVATVCAVQTLFLAWSLWNAKFRKIPLQKFGNDAVDKVLARQTNMAKSEMLQRGWLTNTEWLALNRTIKLGPPEKQPGMHATRPMHRDYINSPGPYNQAASMKNEAGEEVRFIADPLANTYLAEPGEYCLDGMLPPVEFEIQALCSENLVATARLGQLGFMSKYFWNRDEFEARMDTLLDSANKLKDLLQGSDEGKAAFRRILTRYAPYDTPAYLQVFTSFI